MNPPSTVVWYGRTLSWLAFGLVLFRSFAWSLMVSKSGFICIIPGGYWRFTTLPLLAAALFTISRKKPSLCFALSFHLLTLFIYVLWFRQTLIWQHENIQFESLFGFEAAEVSDIGVLAIVLVVIVVEAYQLLWKSAKDNAETPEPSA